jgi:hypothetical protein
MFGYRGRGGPSRAAPASVQCQKCLKRGHYSYECKASAQERPYVSRPSRSQQLRNPKLVPKLTNDSPNPLEKKKGIADEELAKKDAERARKRELEERDDELIRSASKRQRSASRDSVSTISTRESDASRGRQQSRSPSPPARDRSMSPRSQRDLPRGARSASRSASPRSYRRDRSLSRDDGSLSPNAQNSNYRSREPPSGSKHQDNSKGRGRRLSSTSRASQSSKPHHAGRSRSPSARQDRYDNGRASLSQGAGREDSGRQWRGRDRQQPANNPPRERSLSPFSKRLALTRSMNDGR